MPCEAEGVPAEGACLGDAGPLVSAPNGDLLFAEAGRVPRIDATSGLVSVVFVGCPGGTEPCNPANDLAVDAAGNLFLTSAHRVWRVGHDTGAATSIAGNGAEP